jgi:transcriptional regulator with XRE-family HTH domain
MVKRGTQLSKPQYRRTFIRQWREYRDLTLEQLADRVGTTHATLSRLERGLHPYSQALLESLADVLQTDAASLLIRPPNDPEGIWSVWERAKPGERRMIVDIAKTVVKSET